MKFALAILGALALVLGIPAVFVTPGSPLCTASVLTGSLYLGVFVVTRRRRARAAR